MDKQLGAGALALMIDINDQLAERMPRKATVLRMLGNEVEVQIVGGGKGVFPSVVVPLSAGTEGLVMPMQGSGGYFQPLSIRAAVPVSNGANQPVTATTTGDYPVTNAALTFSGLVPGTVVTVKAEVTFRVNATTGSASFGFQATSNGATALYSGGSIPATAGYTTFVYSAPRTIGADGIVSVVPALRWSSGTVTIAGAYITASVH